MKNVNLLLVAIFLLSCSPDTVFRQEPIDNPYYDQAFDYLDAGKADSAFLAFDKAKDIFIAAQDSLNAANCLIQMAVTLTEQGDYFGGLETSLQAIDYLDSDNPEHRAYISANANNLGHASYQLKDYERASQFFDQAIQFTDDSATRLIYLNNKARVLHDNRQFVEALAIYEGIVKANREYPLEYARSLTNMANARWRFDTTYDPRQHLFEALAIREEQQDLRGLNSSYAHLAAFYEQRNPDSALYYARKRYEMAQRINSADDQVMGAYRLAKLAPPHAAVAFFEAYKRLSDSVQLARNTAKNQFALIRYEVEKNKAENLRLEHANTKQAYQLNRQRLLIYVVVFVALTVMLLAAYWQRKRKQRLELQAQNRIKDHQLHTSRKIHDVVANGIYRVMAEVENQAVLDREGLLDRLEDMYEKSRDISYETQGETHEKLPFHNHVANLLRSFATDTTKVIIVGNEPELWQAVGGDIKHHVEPILQELMVNMRKHSGASNVAIRFGMNENHLLIHYKDNGRGMAEPAVRKTGLTSTGNRIEGMGGHLTFENETGGGLRITLSVPLV